MKDLTMINYHRNISCSQINIDYLNVLPDVVHTSPLSSDYSSSVLYICCGVFLLLRHAAFVQSTFC